MPEGIDRLAALTNRQLSDRWTELGIRGKPPHFKQALVRGIAWHVQQRAHGRLDADTRRLLKAAINNAPLPTSKKRKLKQQSPRKDFQLQPGTTLQRTWRGHTHTVMVLDAGKRFRYRDTEYGSLSEIAREITGARWSGPRFFGLKKLKEIT